MKKLIVILMAALMALASRATLPQPDLIAQIHFAGGNQVSATTNYPAFAGEFSSAEALAMRQQTADKLAPWLAGWLQQDLGTSVPVGAAQLRPLFDDLQASEWYLEARAAAGGRPDVAIAIKLDPARMPVWQAGLRPFFPAATFNQSAGWLIFDSGTGAAKISADLVQKISLSSTGWLSIDINWPRLAQWYPALQELALPETLFKVTPARANLQINGKFFFPENLSFKLDPWQIPAATIHQPLTSFTAVRGFANWLNGQGWAQPVELSPPANQLFTWALNGVPFQSYAAVPVADSAAALSQLDAGLQPVVADRDAHQGFISPAFALSKANQQIALHGAPIITPFVQALSEPAGQFLLAGGIANTPKGRPMPAQLLQQLAAPDLVFYHWEVTSERLPEQLYMNQLSLMLTRHKEMESKSAAFSWVNKLAPMLGSTTTAIVQTAPDQLAFIRIAPGGLTSFEFLALSEWLGGDDFPYFNLNLPSNAEMLKKFREHHQNQIKPPAPAH